MVIMTQRREGFAIPLSIMVIGFLSISLMAAYVRVDNDYRVTTDNTVAADAFGLAQTGLDRFITSRTSLGFTSVLPAAAETVTIALPGGSATVILTRVRDTVGGANPLYVVRSTGTTTAAAMTGYLPSRHTVAQYAMWKPGSMDVHAGWTSIGGLHKNGSSGTLTGVDNCGVGPPVAGVGVPDGSWSVTGGGFTPGGTPPVEYMGTDSAMSAAIDIDWAGIVAGTAIAFERTIPSASWPSSFPSNWWPVIYVNQASFSIPADGQGTLVVRGDLTVNGNKKWDGIVLVGGALISDGNNTFSGAVITGLNYKLGESIGTSDFGNGTKTYQYDSCAVKNALNSFGALVALENTWIDNWAW
jgi:hypothetical protein